MKHDIHLHVIPPLSNQRHVAALRYPVEAQIDPLPFQSLVGQRGSAESEEIVCRVLEDVALRLDLLQLALTDHTFPEIAKQARRIQQIALGIGLTDVQTIAMNAAVAAEQADGIAVHATIARLERSFDVAVTEIWNLRDGTF